MTEGDQSGSQASSGSATGGYFALRLGTRLDNRYVVQSVLGAGGFGITYVAEHAALGTHYAIKENFPRQCAYRDAASAQIVPTDPPTYRWALDRFLDEGRRLAKCRHPNVVSVTNVFEENGTAYMVLDYEEGRTLTAWLAALGRAPTQTEIDAILAPLLDALDYVHGQGILHRDIAPDNIMIRADGKPCLIDFGAAREAIAGRSQALSAVVKPGYSPLEQFSRDSRMQGPWSDIYALGATLYRMVAGRAPPDATDRAVHDELPPLADMLPDPSHYRASFLDGIDWALRLKQADRPADVSAWRARLLRPGVASPATHKTVVHAAPVASPPSSTPRPSPVAPSHAAQLAGTPVARSRTPVLIGAVLALVVAAGAMAAVLNRSPSRPAPSETSAVGNAALPPATEATRQTPAAPPATTAAATPAPPTATPTRTTPVPPTAPPATAVPTPATTRAATATTPAPSARRREASTCFEEFRSKAKQILPAADADACVALCDGRPAECDAWEFLEAADRRTTCALFAPAPGGSQLCSTARRGSISGAIGYRQ